MNIGWVSTPKFINHPILIGYGVCMTVKRNNRGRFTKGSKVWLGKSRSPTTRKKIAATLRKKVEMGEIINVGGKRIWTPEEIELLKKYYPRGEIDKLIEMLGRTKASIQSKAWNLGLRVKGLKPAEVDNFSDFDLGYLAGMIEGEGSISIQAQGKGKYAPTVMVTSNTDKEVVKHVMEILDRAGFKAYMVTNQKGRGRRKPVEVVIIKGITYVYPFLKKIKPYIKGRKREIASLVIKFCESRIPKAYLRNKSRKYSKEELDIVERVRRLNMEAKGRG